MMSGLLQSRKYNQPDNAIEAIRDSFKKAWRECDYATIITVANKIPENVLHEDPKLLMWYDQALTRAGGTNHGWLRI